MKKVRDDEVVQNQLHVKTYKTRPHIGKAIDAAIPFPQVH